MVPRSSRCTARVRDRRRLQWLRGPAITEIDSPHLRVGHRLITDPAESGPGSLPLTSMRENEAGIDMGILMGMWESDWVSPGRCRVQLAPNLDLEASNPFEPMFAVRHALSQFFSAVEPGGVGSERSVSSRWWARRGRVGAPALRDQDACRGRAPSLPGSS